MSPVLDGYIREVALKYSEWREAVLTDEASSRLVYNSHGDPVPDTSFEAFLNTYAEQPNA